MNELDLKSYLGAKQYLAQSLQGEHSSNPDYSNVHLGSRIVTRDKLDQIDWLTDARFNFQMPYTSKAAGIFALPPINQPQFVTDGQAASRFYGFNTEADDSTAGSRVLFTEQSLNGLPGAGNHVPIGSLLNANNPAAEDLNSNQLTGATSTNLPNLVIDFGSNTTALATSFIEPANEFRLTAHNTTDTTSPDTTGGNDDSGNPPPASSISAVNDTLSSPVDEDNSITFAISDLTQNDSEGVTLASISAQHGSVTFDTNSGTITYTPDPDYFNHLATGQDATDTLTYTVQNSHGQTASAQAVITVSGVNDRPSVQSQTINGFDSTTSYSGNLLDVLHATDPEGQTLSIQSPGNLNGIYGDLVLNADGSYSYTFHDPSALLALKPDSTPLTDTFTFTAVDTQGGSISASLSFVIHGLNQPTVILSPLLNFDMDKATQSSFNDNILAQVTGVDDDENPILMFRVSDPDTPIQDMVVSPAPGSSLIGTYGTFTLNAQGGFKYTLNEEGLKLGVGQTRVESINYHIFDGQNTVTGTLQITIHGANDAPTATPIYDPSIITENGSSSYTVAQLLANAQDINGDPLSIGNVAAEHGAITFVVNELYPDGAYIYTPSDYFRYLDANQTATETIHYTISDGNGGTASGSVLLQISGINEAPVTTPGDLGSIDANQTFDFEATQIFQFVSDYENDDLVFTPDGYPNVDPQYGVIVANPDGSFSFQPSADFFASFKPGESQTIDIHYTVLDEQNNTASGTVTLTVNGVNDVPIPYADSYNVLDGNAIIIDANLLALRSSDPDADSLSVTSIYADDPASGQIEDLGDGFYRFTPSHNYFAHLAAGEIQTVNLSYTLSDGTANSLGSISVTVTGINDAPYILDGMDNQVLPGSITEDQTQPGGYQLVIAIRDIFNAIGDVDTPDSQWFLADGVYAQNGFVYGDNSYGINDYVYYQPQFNAYNYLADGQAAYDTLTFYVNDNAGGQVTVTARVTITGINDAPVIESPTLTIDEDSSNISGNLLSTGNYSDAEGQAVSVTDIASLSNANSQVVLNPDGSLQIQGSYGTLTIDAAGNYDYELNTAAVQWLGANSPPVYDQFLVTASDTQGGLSNPVISIAINGVNDIPTAQDQSPAGIDEDYNGIVSGQLTDNANDPDATSALQVATIRLAGGGNLILNGQTPSVTLNGNYGSLTVNLDGSYQYQLNTDSVQSLTDNQHVTDQFLFTLTDGIDNSVAKTLTITINGSNDLPVASTQTQTIDEDTANTGGSLLTGASDIETATPDLQVVAIRPLDSLEDTNLDAMTDVVTIQGTYGNLTVHLDGSYSYEPITSNVQYLNTNDSVQDTFIFTLKDSDGGSSSSTLTINITGTNDSPNAALQAPWEITEDTVNLKGNLLTDASDPEMSDLQVVGIRAADDSSDTTLDDSTNSVIIQGVYGSLTVHLGGGYTYVPSNSNLQYLNDNQTVTDSFVYTIQDSDGATASNNLIIKIKGSNDATKLIAYSQTLDEDDSSDLIGNVLAGAQDPESSDLTVVAASPFGTPLDEGSNVAAGDNLVIGVYGTLTIDADGSYSYHLDTDKTQFLGGGISSASDVFTFRVSDNVGGLTEKTISFTITGSNDAPIVNGTHLGTMAADSSLGFTLNQLIANDYDPDTGDHMTLTDSYADHGIVFGEIATGLFSYTPINNYYAYLTTGQTTSETVHYQLTDNHGVSTYGTATITITGINDAPQAGADTKSAIEGVTSAYSGNLLTNDMDADNGDTKTLSAISLAANGTNGIIGASSTYGPLFSGIYGSLQVASDGSYQYFIDNDSLAVQSLESGQTLTDVFNYTMADSQGLSSTSTLTIIINGIDHAIVAGTSGNDVLTSDGHNEVLDGLSGTDTADYSSSIAGVTVNLSGSTQYGVAGFRGAGGYAQNDTYINIENIIGSSYDDIFIGNANTANVFYGSLGADTLVGAGSGANADTVDYSSSPGGAGIIANLSGSSVTINGIEVAANSGASTDGSLTSYAAGDTYINVDRVIGSNQDDVFIANANANYFNGNSGNDTLNYSQVNSGVKVDLLTLTAIGIGANSANFGGTDTFNSIETFVGSSLDDTFIDQDSNNNGGNGQTYDGGSGIDTIDYSSSPLSGSNGVIVNLSTSNYTVPNGGASWGIATVNAGKGHGGYATNDTYINIENAKGTTGNDILIGNSSDNRFIGNGGTDRYEGGAGNDTYVLSNGASTVIDSSGTADAIDLSNLTTKATFYLGNNFYADGVAGSSFSGIEIFYGTNFDDSLTMNSANTIVYGGAGNDGSNGLGGNDTFYGQEGDDLFIFNFGSGNDKFYGGDANADSGTADWISLEFNSTGPNTNWTLHLTGSSVENPGWSGPNTDPLLPGRKYINLSLHDGYLVLNSTGERLDFWGVEKIYWVG